MLAATACVGFWLGWRIGGTARHAWVAGLLTLFSGFYTKFWGEIDTFAPYALVGSLCLVVMGVGRSDLTARPPLHSMERASRHTPQRLRRLWLIAGALAGLGHLTRADGLLLLIVGALVIVWMGGVSGRTAVRPYGGLSSRWRRWWSGYGLVMLPYFVRNLQAIGSPLPLGGTQAIWFGEYNDLFNYPPDSSPATLFANGLGTLISSRREALVNNIWHVRGGRGADRHDAADADRLVAAAARFVSAAVRAVCAGAASGDDVRLSVSRLSRWAAAFGGGADPVLGGAGRGGAGRRDRLDRAAAAALERAARRK